VSTTLYLVRHAAHDDVGSYLAGRLPGIHLGSAGLAQADRLAARLATTTLETILCSPRERARATAAAIARGRGIEPQPTPALDEIDFGCWSGQRFEALAADPRWRRWNAARSLARTPGGECMLDVQRRVVALIEGLSGPVLLVSHADVIKAAVCHYLGLALDAWSRFDIAPASISVIEFGEQVVLARLNEGVS